MSDPVFRPLNTGNTQDDDGTVIDSLVEAVSAPPTPVVEPFVTPALTEPKVTTRLLSVRQQVNPAWDRPTLMLPEDTRRRSLHIRARAVSGGSADDSIVISSDLRSPGGLGQLHTDNSSGLDLVGHTGSVYVSAVGSFAVLVDVWAVTE